MSTPKKDFGFPRWGPYGSDREAKAVRLCDFHGCGEKGECPAPKSPYTEEKWMFCADHAAEYNKNWNFFEGSGLRLSSVWRCSLYFIIDVVFKFNKVVNEKSNQHFCLGVISRFVRPGFPGI